MRLSDRARDWAVTGAFLAIIGGLVALGWFNREAAGTPRRALAAGARAPALELPTVAGDGLALDSLRGDVVLLNIWATWCGPCRQEMPALERVYRKYRGRGLRVVSVAVDDHPGERQPDGRVVGAVSRFMERYGLTFPVALDPTGGTEASFETEYLPTTVLIDRDGVIRSKEVGAHAWDQTPYVDRIETMLEERNQ